MADPAFPTFPSAYRQMDPFLLHAFLGKGVVDMCAAMHAALVVIGDKLGLYKAMAGTGPISF